jgi:hypothetical protein
MRKRIGIEPPFRSEEEKAPAEVPLRHYVGATLFLFFSGGFFFYWMAFPLVNTVFFDGLAQLGTPPPPGQTEQWSYRTARYGWDWWLVWLLSLNGLLPMMLAWAMAHSGIEQFARLHAWFAKVGLVVNVVVVVILTIRWGVNCNNGFSGGNTACNDARWCCRFFPSPWCPNGAPCGYDVAPDITSEALVRSQEMLQHWAFGFVFFVFACWHVSINTDLREFGVLN